MEQIITAKLKLLPSPEQHDALRQTQLAYRNALNYISVYAFEQGKISNEKHLHKGTYYNIRAKFKLPSEMTNNAIRQVGSTYKGLWTKAKKNKEHLHKKITKKRYKGLDKPPRFVSPTITYNYGYDYSFKPNQQVSIKTLGKRIILSYEGRDKHLALIQRESIIRSGRLWYDKRRKQFYLLVCLAIDVSAGPPETYNTIVGVDVGQRYLATTATIKQHQRFFSGKAVRAQSDHYARRRKTLQRKGTRSALRRLRLMNGRERRFKLDTNHVIAKKIIKEYPHALIGLEDLTDIRDRTKRPKKRRRGKKILPLTPTQRRANRRHTNWSFAELQNALTYKAKLADSVVIKVDANYTNLACPMCGYCDEKNRPDKGLLFICQNKQCIYRLRTGRPYTLHADLVGARNIAMRTLLIQQDWMRTGILSVCPDVSSDKAKAERLKRYSDLRWSSDTSSLTWSV
jgi:IS605 OrfB family transposase